MPCTRSAGLLIVIMSSVTEDIIIKQNGSRTQAGGLLASVIPFARTKCPKCRQRNPFRYLTEQQRHAAEVERTPAAWMPWNYGENLTPLATAA